MTEFSKTKTHAIDPINFNKYRCEFRLPSSTVLLSKMSIMNLGVHGDVARHEFINSIGVKGLIKKLSLYDGNQKLDEINHFNLWSAYDEYHNDNDKARDMDNYLSGSSFGFTVRDKYDLTGNTEPLDAEQVQVFNRVKHAELLEDDTFKGVVSLFKELDFLKNSLVVPTTIFKNLRVVIEFQTDMSQVFKTIPASHTLLRPFIVVQEIVDEPTAVALLKQYKGVAFQALEDDVIPVKKGSLVAIETQETKKKINGFNGKMLNKLIIQKERTENKGAGVKQFGSVAQVKEAVNFTVNGKKLLPFEGCDRTNKRLGVLHMTNGTHNTVLGVESVGTSNIVVDDTVGQLVSNCDYMAFNIVDRVRDLQIDYKRESHPGHSGEYNQALNLNVYGKVSKAVVVNGANYVVEYQ